MNENNENRFTGRNDFARLHGWLRFNGFDTAKGRTRPRDRERRRGRFPAWKADIDFALQYRESDWRFLQRMCR